MYDLLPFPNIVGATIEEQTAQINNYLIQLKETLEFVLTDISVENLSQELVNKLNDLGANIEKSTEEQEDQLNQIANKTLTVSDVINSSAFETALDDATPKKYLVSVEQTQSSDEPEGVNIYAFEDGNGEVKQLTIKNGKDGKDGKDGANGIDGEDGQDGQDGITPTFKIEEGELKVSYDDGETWTSLGYIYGENGVMGIDGDDGIDGVGITKTEINSNGELVITYSNNLISNLGVVVGAKGDKGDKGDKGEQGIQGVKGDKGDKGDTGAKGEKGDKGEQGVPGPQGAQGIQGIQGVQGEKGQDGKDGINGKDGYTPIKNVDYFDGINGKDGVNGKDGINGVDGVGIKTVAIDSGNLKVTLTSGTTLNLGNIKGQDGQNGVDGKTPNISFSVNFSTGNLEYITS